MDSRFARRIPLLAAAAVVAWFGGCGETPFPTAALTNPGFEMPLDSGWVSTVVNDTLTSGYIEQSDTLGQPDSGRAVRVYKFHKQYCSLRQEVPIETLDQVARFDARFRLGGFVPCSPAAAVAFDFLDGAGGRLGRTVYCLVTPYNTWTDSDSLHVVRLADTTGLWSEYRLNLRAELDSFLPAVVPEDVRRLGVEIFARVEQSG
jgi:hypothetical protein